MKECPYCGKEFDIYFSDYKRCNDCNVKWFEGVLYSGNDEKYVPFDCSLFTQERELE